MTVYRSKEFLAFVHAARRGGRCIACDDHPWTELHHCGDDGGVGLKPSDYMVVRLCEKCHHDPMLGRKLRAIRRADDHDLAADYLRDAVQSLMMWAAHVESHLVEYQDKGCARDELVEWLTDYDGQDLEAAEKWLLAWSHRRHLNALAGMSESLSEILKAEELEDAKFVALRGIEAWK